MPNQLSRFEIVVAIITVAFGFISIGFSLVSVGAARAAQETAEGAQETAKQGLALQSEQAMAEAADDATKVRLNVEDDPAQEDVTHVRIGDREPGSSSDQETVRSQSTGER